MHYKFQCIYSIRKMPRIAAKFVYVSDVKSSSFFFKSDSFTTRTITETFKLFTLSFIFNDITIIMVFSVEQNISIISMI